MMRSWLFVPGDSEKTLAKAVTTEADLLIRDLEDSVAPERKPVARELAREAIAEAPARAAVRINPLTSPYAREDLHAVARAGPAAIVLPKCEKGADVTELSVRLSVEEAEAGLEDGAIKIMALAPETA
ncbi:MAG: aldolase/citrate lyase family protein, partial [Pseudomonadota bacterium]